ncbi:hypothetical protein [Psychrobacter sp. UBA2769]|uniref:hypothetical protein n=1 Tax=Psychrobacter sp. UBA2769 TaxID=1947348 RepID=UPI0025E10047|nr:hypothetical protein [Psychrobacter sp. UBA2769]
MRQSQKILEANDIYLYRRYHKQMFVIVGFFLFSLGSNSVGANQFATPDDFSAASCPIDHKKYSIRNNASTATTPSLSSWKAGETSRTFTFEENSGNKIFTINFPILIDANNSNGTVPFYGSINDATSNAINLLHNSTRVQTDHTLDVSINRPVSKIGYKIQDLDSTTVQVNVGPWWNPRYETRTPYIEQVDVSTNDGRLTFNDIFHKINAGRNIVTAKDGENCSTGQCTIDATWSYKTANSVINLKHNNDKRETGGSHAVGYSDFYFCLAPPKIIVNKLLNGSRVDSDDQFRIELLQTSDDAFVEAFTTTGSGSVVTDNTTTVKRLKKGFNYTVSEQTINGNLLDYQTNYTCSNAATGTDVTFSSGTMPVNAAGTRRTFAINNVDYGDEITCNITNTPVNNYTFTGFVFNDNGGIARSTNPDTKSDVSATFMNNSKYFNGKFDSGELGIYDINLKVRLTDCGPNGGTDITGTTPQTVSNIATTLGRYQFTVPANAIANKPRVCLVQVEPNSWDYSIDTTPNIREVTLKNDVFDYKTEGLVNLDFGEVEADYAAIVLRKAQFVNDCPSTLDYTASTLNTPGNTNPRTGFSESSISGSDLIPGQCIAYRITATNRANLPVSNFVMRDILQKKGDKGALVTSVLTGPIDNDSNYALTSSVPIGENGTVVTTESVINSKASRRFYFNTKYGTTVDP